MSTSTQAPATPRGSPGTATRALAPDLARGAMLLIIAFAHAPLYVLAVERGPAVANGLIHFFHMLFVHNHGRPLFAFLFGYALVQLLNQQARRGSDWVTARKLLRRRGWWLIAIGFAHVVLLVPLDILAPYGLTAILLVGLLRAKDSTLLWTAGLTLIPSTLAVASAMWFAMSRGASTFSMGGIAAGTNGLGEMLATRVQGWPIGLAVGTLSVVPGVVLGIWAARRRFLEEPARHRRFLVSTAVVTTVLSIAGAVPAGLVQAGVWAPSSGAALWAAALAQPLTGFFGGIGLAGLIALVAMLIEKGITGRPGRLTTAVQALGQRSMSMYLFQSIAFVAVFSPYFLGLQDDLGLTGATGVAAATWLLSLLIADFMRRADHRGPAEILLRRLAYRQRRSPRNSPA